MSNSMMHTYVYYKHKLYFLPTHIRSYAITSFSKTTHLPLLFLPNKNKSATLIPFNTFHHSLLTR